MGILKICDNFWGPNGPILKFTFLESLRNLWLFGINKKDGCFFFNLGPLQDPCAVIYFVFFRRKFSEKSKNSPEIPKILRKFRKFSENSENSQKFLKIRRKFLKKKVFSEAKILYRYRIVSNKKNQISYRVEKKCIAQGWCLLVSTSVY